MRTRMHQVFPQLKDVDIDYVWGGYVDISMSRAPHWGRIGQNLYFAQGFSGHGIAATGLAGRVIAEAIHGQSTPPGPVRAHPAPQVPGRPRTAHACLVLAMLWFRMKDWW
jgi:gamma-glutamylputrescine oxidase